MKKKLTALLLALGMLLALAACGNGAGGASNPPESSAPAEAPSQAPSEEPSEAPSEEPSEAPSEPAGEDDLTAFYEAVMAKYEFPPMVLAEGDMLENFYPGLSALADVAEFQVYTPMMSGSPFELTLVRVQPGGGEDVWDIFDARVAACTEDGPNYPDTIDAWLNNCRQIARGDVMLLVVHEMCDDIAADFEDAFPEA